MAELTIQQTFDLAVRHHQAGRLQEAEQLYRQILAQKPGHADAIHLLGVIAYQTGHNDDAVDLIRQAVALKPDFPEAHYNLGNALRTIGRFDEAIAAYRQAIALRPNSPEAQSNLGNALKDNGQLDEAIIAYRRAIALNPNLPGAYSNLGNALIDKGQLNEAIAAFRPAIALNPNLPEAHSNLGNALKNKGHIDEAIAAYRRAIELQPNLSEAHFNLGTVLKGKGQIDEAIAAYHQAIALRPNYAEAHSNLGIALKDKGKLDEAIAALRKAISLRPDYADFHNNLGLALNDKGQVDEAIAAYQQAIALNPDLPEAHSNLGIVLKEKGQLDEAIAAYRQAIALRPSYAEAHGNLVFVMQYHAAYDERAIAEEERRWNHQHAEPLKKLIQPPSTSSGQAHTNNRDPDRRLRIGYVSPDFRDHVVGQNLLPLFQHHDRRQFEINCYAHVLRSDTVTRHLQQSADRWRDIVGLSDEQVAQQIREDQIDILVDLALHTGHNRLLVFARKPAPVQVCYLGYCGSTGLSAMDYRLSDPHLDPPDTDLSCYSEKTLRLPRTYWCYQPDITPAPSPSPALKNGFITFGCLNNFAKVSLGTVDLWAKILAAVPNSRLILHAYPGKHLDEVTQRLDRAKVPSHRLHFVGRQSSMEYLQTYSRIDIALDPFPYGGGITTCDALWMGVPVVTLSGQTAVGRGGRSILSNLGLPELIAFTPDQYVQIAIELASDRNRMNTLRQNMRSRMLASPLMDAAGFARDMESAYRLMWRAWCETRSD